MALSFLSPWSALVALAGAVPLAAFLWADRRSSRVAAALRLPVPARTRAGVVLAVAATAALVGAAAAEPVVDRNLTRYTRDDAEAFVVIDTSRSMLARRRPGSATRIARAKALALRLRERLGDVKVGVASMTDRTLPHLFPTSDDEVFRRVVLRSVGVERPPPSEGSLATRATTLEALSTVATRDFYSAAATHRLLVVFSDFESDPFSSGEIGRLFRKPPGIKTIFVRIWHPEERVYIRSTIPESAYQPDPTSAVSAARLAVATGGRTFSDAQLGAIVAAAKRDLGAGKPRAHGQERGKYSVAPYVALAAVLPLGFLLWRRNL